MQTIQYSDFKNRYDVNFRAKPNDEDFVGAGGFGYVYKGYDKLKHTPVAIKRSATDKNLLDEVEKAKQLPQHVNIARYLEGFRIETEADDFDVAILQYYPKGNLNQLIASGELNDTQIRDLVLGILEGISFLHKGFTDSNGKHRSIIHRDLKPQNILIAEYKGAYTPLITDFGISKLVKAEDIHSTGGIELSNQMGTMMYKAPEQVLGGTVRSNLDLWAFGIILFKMLTGKLPFNADTQMSTESVLNKITKSDLEEIFIQLKNYPDVYQQIIRKCLVRNIKTRVQTADELIEMLKDSPKVLAKEKVVKTQSSEERTDDRVTIRSYNLQSSKNISVEELAIWNQANALSILSIGSIHKGEVIKISKNKDVVILLQYGVTGKITKCFEDTNISIHGGDHVEVEIISCDFEKHEIELKVISNLSEVVSPKLMDTKKVNLISQVEKLQVKRTNDSSNKLSEEFPWWPVVLLLIALLLSLGIN
jgi:serine/threonine protein kinase